MQRIDQPAEQGATEAVYVLVGVGSIGLRGGLIAGRLGVRAGRVSRGLAGHLPGFDAAVAGLAREGRRTGARMQSEARRAGAALARSRLLDRLADELLRSDLVVDLVDQVLTSPEMQRAIERVASSPELRSAIAEQSAGMAREMVGGVRNTSIALDDASERTVRRWLRRPPRTA